MATLTNGMTPPSGGDYPAAYPSASPSPPPTFQRTVQSRSRRDVKCGLKPRNAPNPDNTNQAPAAVTPTSTNPSAPTQSQPVLSPVQRSATRGYSDGFLTARIFSLYSLSKLGFQGQYIADSIAALGPRVVAPGTEAQYQEGFLKGLADGEAVVAAGISS